MENHQILPTPEQVDLHRLRVSNHARLGRHSPIVQVLLLLLTAMSVVLMPALTKAQANSTGSSPQIPFSELVDLAGQPVNQEPVVGDGKWTLVMIWVTNCHVCRAQKSEINAFHEAHRERDATVVGIAMDGSAKLSKVKRFLSRYEVTFPSYVGDMMSVMKQYEVLTRESFEGTPTYLLFDRAGTLRGSNSGPITVSAIERFIERHDQRR